MICGEHGVVEECPACLEDKKDDEIDRLRAELEQERDIRQDREALIDLIAKELGVSTEPHQTFFERVLNEATCTNTRVRELEEACREIEALGHGSGSGRGYTCANIAQKALANSEKED